MQNPFNPEPIEKFVHTLNAAPWYSKLARAILSFFARRIGNGYGLVPMAWPRWSIKAANCEQHLAKIAESKSFAAGYHAGKAEAYRRVAAEIETFQKNP